MVNTSGTFRYRLRGLFFFLFIFLSSYSMAQPKNDWLRTVDYIPMHGELDPSWLKYPHMRYAIDTVRNAGMDVIITNIYESNWMNFIHSDSLRTIVGEVKDPHSSDTLNYIAYYTDAKYSVWEAEATPGPKGDAVLLRNIDKTLIVPGNTSYVSIMPDFNRSTFEMIYGPYYHSEVKYFEFIKSDKDPVVKYTINYRLMLQQKYPDSVGNLTDTICRLRVQYSNHDTLDHLGPTYAPRDTILTLADFTTNDFYLNQFQDHMLRPFDLTVVPSPGPGNPIEVPEQYSFSLFGRTDSIPPGTRDDRGYMQYKVIWLGNPYYILSVDKVIISDQRGRDLKNPLSTAKTDIIYQANALNNNYPENVVGWLAVDEPTTIDCYEPIRIVQDILDSLSNYTCPLWIQNMGKWSGTWENPLNHFGAMKLSPWTEFRKRVGHANLWQDFYYFDYPYYETYNPPGGDYRDNNITAVGDLNYKQAYNLDPGFGANIQCGEVHHAQAEERNINANELLYETNLGLMYGAKFISFYSFIAQKQTDQCNSGFTCRAIIDLGPNDSLIFTDKYYMVIDTISPRLHGLFGKTIKKLIPTNQFTGVNGIKYKYGNPTPDNQSPQFEFIENVVPVFLPPRPDIGIDLGFFQDAANSDKKYFMVLNRHYSNYTRFNIKLKNLTGYLNWRLTDFRDTASITIPAVNNKSSFIDTMVAGDAGFYSLLPVVKYGGDLKYNETIIGVQTLQDTSLCIKNGATLTVNGTYNIYKNITVDQGGTLALSANAHLNFLGGSQLILNGSVKGIASAKAVLNFNNQEYSGIIINSPDTVQNIIITNSNPGISLGLPHLRGTSTPPGRTTLIKNVVFQTAVNGIFAINFSNLAVLNCEFHSEVGIALINVTNFDIIGNYFSQGENQSTEGFAINATSSSGRIRSNVVHNFYGTGLYLGGSTVEMGNNQISENFNTALYIMEGSQVDMRGKLIYNPSCPQNLIYFPFCGFNNINNNNQTDSFGGAEIVLNNGDILLDEGYNIISDCRKESFATQTLMDGETNADVIYARHNEWGSLLELPTEVRFGNLNVMFEPSGAYLPDRPVVDCDKLIIYSFDNVLLDTLQAQGVGPEQMETLTNMINIATEKQHAEDYAGAESDYKNILSIYYDNKDAQKVYHRLLEVVISKRAANEEFISLRNYYLSKLNYITQDELYKDVANLANICLIYANQIHEARERFESIINTYPGTEQAIVAEINLYAAALYDTSQTLGKEGKFGKITSTNCFEKIMGVLLKNSKNNLLKVLPVEYNLFQNYPNPFNPSTNIRYAIKDKADVKLIVYDILGRVVKYLVNEVKEPGYYDVQLNMSNYASGVYFYTLQTKNYVRTNKMLYIK